MIFFHQFTLIFLSMLTASNSLNLKSKMLQRQKRLFIARLNLGEPVVTKIDCDYTPALSTASNEWCH